MPVTGYLGTGINTDYFFIGEITGFKDTAVFTTIISDCPDQASSDCLKKAFKKFEKPIDFIHKDIMGKWLVWILVLGHIGFALYHHFVKKDHTLEKMRKNRNRDRFI